MPSNTPAIPRSDADNRDGGGAPDSGARLNAGGRGGAVPARAPGGKGLPEESFVPD